MLRNLSIVVFLGLAACGGSKSEPKAPASTETTTDNATPAPSSAGECCCQTEMHSCSMKASDACEQDDGNCTGDDAAHCDCEGGDEGQ